METSQVHVTASNQEGEGENESKGKQFKQHVDSVTHHNDCFYTNNSFRKDVRQTL